MFDVVKAFTVAGLVLIIVYLGWGLSEIGGHSQQARTAAAFGTWASKCQPDDFHYGQTNDGAGQRAFIVTCSEAK